MSGGGAREGGCRGCSLARGALVDRAAYIYTNMYIHIYIYIYRSLYIFAYLLSIYIYICGAGILIRVPSQEERVGFGVGGLFVWPCASWAVWGFCFWCRCWSLLPSVVGGAALFLECTYDVCTSSGPRLLHIPPHFKFVTSAELHLFSRSVYY